jgi:membrane associated rhomboid family serine protease
MSQFRPNGFQTLPTVIKNLIIINGIFFLANIILAKMNIDLAEILGLHAINSSDADGNTLFKPYQLITHLFMHGGSMMGEGADYNGGIMHLFSNLFGLWMFGSVLEQMWGPKRFLQFYFICGIGAAALYLAWLYFQYPSGTNENCVGASGAIFGVIGAFAYLFPNTYLYLYFFVPVKTKYAIALYAAYELYSGILQRSGDNIAHFAHLGGLIVGIALVWWWNKTNKKSFY